MNTHTHTHAFLSFLWYIVLEIARSYSSLNGLCTFWLRMAPVFADYKSVDYEKFFKALKRVKAADDRTQRCFSVEDEEPARTLASG